MEDSELIKRNQTSIKSNWILDTPITEQNNYLVLEDDYIFDAIETEVKIPRFEREHDSLSIDEANNDESNYIYSLPSGFNLPDFKEKINLDFKNYSSQTQKWIGYVIQINKDDFEARLEDVNKPDTYETGEFNFKDVSREDKELLKIGAVFYWSIGQEIRNGQVSNQSLIRFKRDSGWSVDEIDSAADRASELSKKIKWD